MIIKAGRVRRQLCRSGPRTRFSARTVAQATAQLDVIARQGSDPAGHDVICGQGSATSATRRHRPRRRSGSWPASSGRAGQRSRASWPRGRALVLTGPADLRTRFDGGAGQRPLPGGRRAPLSTATGACPVPAPAGGRRSPQRICPCRARPTPAGCRPAGSVSLSLRASARRGRATAHHRR